MKRASLGRRRDAKREILATLAALLLLFSSFPLCFVQFYGYDLVYAETGVTEKQKALSFLTQVVGINSSSYNVLSSSVYKFKIPDSGHYQTDVSIAVKSNNCTFNVLITFIDGKLWTYDLDSGSIRLVGKETLADSLFVAKGTIEGYRGLFNAAYCSELEGMISTALQNRTLTVENNASILKASYVENCSTPLDYKRCTDLQWFKKIKNQFTDGSQSISMSVSKNGLLTLFVDNLAIFYLASTDIRISEEEALNITMPYAEAYSAEHGQKIVFANATLEWDRDLNSSRGDDFAIYPRWLVSVTFDNANDEGVSTYGASIWADNGQIASQGPQMFFGAHAVTSTGSDNVGLWLIFAAIGAFPAFICLATYLKRRSKKDSEGRK
jgi:hypothetical protein